MKKLFVIAAAMVVLASCGSSNKAFIAFEGVSSAISSFTSADLQVSDTAIKYSYYPTKAECKSLKEGQMILNATYKALEGTNYDTMIGTKIFFAMGGKTGKDLVRIDITGYPARYVNFRQPTEDDRQNARSFKYETVQTTVQKGKQAKDAQDEKDKLQLTEKKNTIMDKIKK